MKKNKDISFKKFAYIGFSLIIALFIFSGSISWIEINSLGKLTSTIHKHPLEVSNAALRASQSVVKMHRSMKDVVLAENERGLENDIAHVNNEEKIVYENLDIIRKLILGAEGQSLAREAKNLFAGWKPIREEVINLVKNGDKITAARITKGKGANYELLLEKKMTDLTLYARRKADSFMKEAAALLQRTTYITVFIITFGAFFSIVVAFFTFRQITRAFDRQKKAEEYLSVSEKKFKSFMMSATEGFNLFDSKLNLVDINDKALEIFPPGTDRNTLLGKNILDISPGIKETDRYDKYLEVMKTGEPLFLDDIIPGPTFDKVHLSFKAFKVGDGLGLIFSDITDRIRAAEDIQKATTIINRSPAVAFLWENTAGWPVEYVSDNASELFGYSAEEFTSGKISYHDTILPDDLERVIDEVTQNSADKDCLSFQHEPYIIVTGEGVEKWVADHTYIVRDENREITHYEGIIYDITEKKQAGDELRIERDNLNSIFEAMEDGVYIVNQKYDIEFVNHTLIKYFGSTENKKCYKHLYDLEEVCPWCKYGEVLKGETVRWNNFNNKNRKTYEFIANPLKRPDGSISKLEIFRDISDNKKREEELIYAKKIADSANRAKSDFLANMSHELRTPLNAIIGFSQILESQISEKINPKQQEFFKHIKDGGTHLLQMVNDILDLSKIEAGKAEIDLNPFDFGRMLERSPAIIQSMAQEKNLQIEVNTQPDLGWLNGDERQLKQVIYNLLSNAVKFTEPGKRIGIDTSVKNDKFLVVVWDEGIGIPGDHLDTIFDPFEQVVGSRFSKEKGTGLGLSISKKLIEMHHGTITVTSIVGEGSRFTITLPGKISGEELNTMGSMAQQKEVNTGIIKDAKILVTEDNETNSELIGAVLNEYYLDFAVSGEEAVALASEKRYNLILMDIQLPEMDGTEAMIQIRKNSNIHIPIIALTSFAMKGDEEKFLKAGFDDYISKPINIDFLIKKVQEVLK